MSATIYNNKIYILENILNFVEKSHSLISYVEYGIIDSTVESIFIRNINKKIDLKSDVIFEVRNDELSVDGVVFKF